METKICNCCKIEKNISDFSNNKRFEDNKNPTCKECDKMRSLKYYYSNKELVELKRKEYIQTEKYKIRRQNYLKKNREEINRVKKLYKLNNRENILQKKKDYYQRKKNDPIFALTKRLRQGIYRSIRGVKLRSSLDILGCTEEKFKIHIENQFTDDMSWDRLNEIHIDHIIPISSAETLEDVYRLNHYTNLQPLWAKDNLSKYNKIDVNAIGE